MPLGDRTCPSPEAGPEASVERKLQDAAAAPDQIISAVGSASARVRAIRRRLLKRVLVGFGVMRGDGGTCDFISISFPSQRAGQIGRIRTSAREESPSLKGRLAFSAFKV